MTTTINLFDHVLARAERHRRHGQTRTTAQIYLRLLDFPDLPPTLAAEVRTRLGSLYLRRRRCARARRHLRRALTLHPNPARVYFLLGISWQRGEKSDLRRAAAHFEQSLKLDPKQPVCLAESGLLVICAGDAELGLRLLRNAFDQAPDDPRVLRRLVRGLLLAGFPHEAVKMAREALFRAPRDRRLREVYTELRLSLVRREQQVKAAVERPEPTILPFIRVVREELDPAHPYREDAAESLPGPHLMHIRLRRRKRRTP